MFFDSIGKLVYTGNPNSDIYDAKLIVEVDTGMAAYYRSVIRKYNRINIPKYPPHITVIRGEKIVKPAIWGKYASVMVEFWYRNTIYNDDVYWWLEVKCDNLEAIRKELGLFPTSPLTMSPDGKHKFHITLANTK